MVPHLTTALSGPLLTLERYILDSMSTIEHWMRGQWRDHEAPFYASVDLRNSGFKLAPVDTNLFPGGFNNLNPDFLPLCIQATTSAIEKICPDAQKLLIIPENHTRNTFYLQNVATLHLILRQAGLNVRIGSTNPEVKAPIQMALSNGSHLLIEPVQRVGRRLVLPDFDPCAVLLNNDLSAGIPDILKGLDQWLLPPLQAGWSLRRKSVHFSHYDEVAGEFARLLDVDPWVINPYFNALDGVDFAAGKDQVELAETVNDILVKTRKKYKEYGI
ncbi:MAG: glutamate--cysteine ligase, partial [Pseudomonadota bacterium]|nr:glutamate--cysteine ligase [Pseudomonadota bacterium]